MTKIQTMDCRVNPRRRQHRGVPAIVWFETRRFATLLTMRIASLDLILRSRRRRRLEGEVVHSASLASCATGQSPRQQTADQLRLLSTSARSLIHGIMARSFSPTASAGCAASLARIALNEVWLTRFSSIQSLANLPDWISDRMRFISARVSALITRGPETYSPYS